MAPGQACKKASAMQHAAHNGGPSTATNKNKIRGGPRTQGQTGAVRQSSKICFLFPSPSCDTSKKNRGKGQDKSTSSWTNPGSAAETPREEESHTANHHGQHPSPSLPFPLHPTCFLMAVLWAARLKNSSLGGSSDTVPHMERNRFPVGATAVAVAWGGGDDKEYAQITKGNLHEPDKQFCAARSMSTR